MLDERGATAVEYGLLVAGIAAVIAAVVFSLGDVVEDGYDDTCRTISSEIQADCS
jgi:pilus assembly protein Flp/PilA